MKAVLFFSVLGIALSGSALSSAQEVANPDFTTGTVLESLMDQADLGASRSICVGTKSECAETKAKPFDMLVNFELDSAKLLPQAEVNLRVVAQALKDDRLSKAAFNVKGFTDSRGAAGHNKVLSELRAKAVSEFLIALDVDPARVVAIGLGESSPRFPDPRDPGNRRVELSLTVK